MSTNIYYQSLKESFVKSVKESMNEYNLLTEEIDAEQAQTIEDVANLFFSDVEEDSEPEEAENVKSDDMHESSYSRFKKEDAKKKLKYLFAFAMVSALPFFFYNTGSATSTTNQEPAAKIQTVKKDTQGAVVQYKLNHAQIRETICKFGTKEDLLRFERFWAAYNDGFITNNIATISAKFHDSSLQSGDWDLNIFLKAKNGQTFSFNTHKDLTKLLDSGEAQKLENQLKKFEIKRK